MAHIKAATCREADVQSAIDQVAAAGGGVAEMPNEQGEWTNGVRVPALVNLIGGGQTLLIDSVPKDGSSRRLITADRVQNGFEMSGFDVECKEPDPMITNAGHIVIAGATERIRVHHIRFKNLMTTPFRIFGAVFGLMDHIEIETPQAMFYGIGVDHSNLFGGDFGDKSWITPIKWGSLEALYIEDCTFRCGNPQQIWGPIDSFGGGRVVVRKNKFYNSVIGSHGTETSGRPRGMLYYEVYDNRFEFAVGADGFNLVPIDSIVGLRSGTMVAFRNEVVGAFRRTGFNRFIKAVYNRDLGQVSMWGKADGTNPYDKNENGTVVRGLDQPGTSLSRDLEGKPVPDQAWFANSDDPIHEWDNRFSDTPQWGVIGTDSPHILEGVHFKTNTVRPGYTEAAYPHPLQTGTPVPPDPIPPDPPDTNTPPTVTLSFDPPLTAGKIVTVKNQKILVKMTDDTGPIWTELWIKDQKVWEGDEIGQKSYTWNTAPYRNKGPVPIVARTKDAEGRTAEASETVTVRK